MYEHGALTKFLLIDLLVLTAVLLKAIIIAFSMLIKSFEKCTLQTELLIAPFV